jgi:hypothetical protein
MVASKGDKHRDLRFSLADLEGMHTHDLAELLANFVLLLRRLPNIPFSDLAAIQTAEREPARQEETGGDPSVISLVDIARTRVNGDELPGWAGKE